MLSIVTKEGCVFNLNYLGMKFFHLFQSFDSLQEKVINIWISIFLNKRIKNLSYYGIGGFIDNSVKNKVWTYIRCVFWDICCIIFLGIRVLISPQAFSKVQVARSFLSIIDNTISFPYSNLGQIIIMDGFCTHIPLLYTRPGF